MKSSESKGYYIVVTICILMLSIISSDIINNPSIENIINLIYYSTVTDLARFLGLSISQPLSLAT